MRTTELTKTDFLKKVANFEKSPNCFKYLGDKPAILDFTTSWCVPCKMIAPMIEELAEEYSDKVATYRINADNEREISSLFGIRTVPTLVFIKKDSTFKIISGAISRAELRMHLDEYLLKENN